MFLHKMKNVGLFLVILLAMMLALMNSSIAQAADDGTAPYQVQSGDTLTKVANRFGLTVEKLLLANPQIDDPNLILTGQVITLPAGRSEGIVVPKGRLFVWQLERNGNRVELSDQFYLVRNNDSLTSIAKRFGVTLEQLLSVNPQIEDQTKFFRGELVKIPDGRSETAPAFYQTPVIPSK